jgi:uncharacterized surface protein with fasciclin (FAS1) repeats
MKKTLFFTLTLLYSLMSSSCSKTDDNNNDQNITSIVSNNPNFSLLALAINRAGLTSTINTSNNITVFAPDNEAFAAAGITESAINSLPVETLAAILKYHVVSSSINSTAVPTSAAVATLEGRKLFASKNANGVFVNGIKVKQADVSASNGIIHVISKVMMPPTQTIAEIASTNPDFSLLLAAVVRAGLATAVSSEGNYTVFAPTNAAFNAAGFNSAADINNADQALISTVVRYHVLPTTVFASDVMNGNVNSLQGGALQISTAPSVKIASSTNPASNIVSADIIATNGVIHVVNRVLLP